MKLSRLKHLSPGHLVDSLLKGIVRSLVAPVQQHFLAGQPTGRHIFSHRGYYLTALPCLRGWIKTAGRWLICLQSRRLSRVCLGQDSTASPGFQKRRRAHVPQRSQRTYKGDGDARMSGHRNVQGNVGLTLGCDEHWPKVIIVKFYGGRSRIVALQAGEPEGLHSPQMAAKNRNGRYHQESNSAVVGSQVQGSYLPVSRLFMSSALSSKSYTFVFSSILECVTLFGRTTNPFCKPQRSKICAAVLLYLATSGLSRGSSPRVARTRGE